MTGDRVAARLLGLMRPLAPLMGVSVACRTVNQGLGVAIPALGAYGVVRIAGGEMDVVSLVGWLAGLAIVKGLFRYLEQYTGHAVAFRLLSKLRVDTYRAIEPLAPAGLEDDRSGDLVSRVVGDVDRVEPFFAHTVAPLTGAVLVPTLAVAGLALAVDPVLGLVLVPFLVALVAIVPWLRRRREAELSSQERETSGATAAALTDAVQGIREIVVFGARERTLADLDRRGERLASIRSGRARIGALRSSMGDALAGGMVVAVALVGSVRVGSGALDLAGLAAGLAVAWVVAGPARAVEEIVPDLEQAIAAARRLFELSDRVPPLAEVSPGAGRPSGGSIRLRSVTAGYARSPDPALDGIELDVDEGEFVAVVGPSGSGKSTLVDLLLRFRDPIAGTVAVGGVDVRRVASADLRGHVALVPQRPDLFHGTIADNLRIAAPEASDADLWRSLERADLATWVAALPGGLDTQVGELGDRISGGQRQRIALARALLRRPEILILDEATSELDPAAEARILTALLDGRGTRTLLVVAHRLEAVTGADRIVVLDRGRLVESGSHADLIAGAGVYAGLWGRHLDAIDAA
jgi:ATP-binding cassette, subfamily C, bacterial CydC